MIVKLEATVRGVFGTTTFSTGAATNADAPPTCVVLEQGTALGYAPTVTNKATGLYEVNIDCTAANGFDVGKEYTAYVVVVMGGVTSRGPVPGISAFTVRARSVDDVATQASLDAVDDYVDTELAALTAAVGVIDDFLDTEVAAILAAVDTEVAALATAVGVIDDFLDTEIVAIKAKTDLIPIDPATETTLAAVTAKTDNLPGDPADASDIAALFAALPSATDVRDEILGYEYRDGRTVRGLFRRWGAMIEGKATGLVSALATFFQPDETTPEFTAAQSTPAGTREMATVTNSETP